MALDRPASLCFSRLRHRIFANSYDAKHTHRTAGTASWIEHLATANTNKHLERCRVVTGSRIAIFRLVIWASCTGSSIDLPSFATFSPRLFHWTARAGRIDERSQADIKNALTRGRLKESLKKVERIANISNFLRSCQPRRFEYLEVIRVLGGMIAKVLRTCKMGWFLLGLTCIGRVGCGLFWPIIRLQAAVIDSVRSAP